MTPFVWLAGGCCLGIEGTRERKKREEESLSIAPDEYIPTPRSLCRMLFSHCRTATGDVGSGAKQGRWGVQSLLLPLFLLSLKVTKERSIYFQFGGVYKF
ncbi:hypothetical protein P167DRAFT_247984 [Morchella conica CCBAS932]|uniref:Uncharacterized protein n=1 Tax=Morchella conica CCBAS932 TaxID=1392247 RepID=A0A3N4KJ12_9PEZI|nr:hypothetical protein P167DRAFT_247984 [Morchella conica CCBAS932]